VWFSRTVHLVFHTVSNRKNKVTRNFNFNNYSKENFIVIFRDTFLLPLHLFEFQKCGTRFKH
jgi:hypothetical protein